MKYSEWESLLVENLQGLPTKECLKITDYYREIYSDKLDAGEGEEAILEEFGEPKLCAEKILAESASSDEETPSQNIPSAQTEPLKTPKNDTKQTNSITVSHIVGVVLFSVFIGIPLAAIAISVIAAFGAACISCGAGVIAGLVYTVMGIFSGASVQGVVAHIGLGLGASGLCGLLAIGCYFTTKYLSIGCYQLFKIIYVRRKK